MLPTVQNLVQCVAVMHAKRDKHRVNHAVDIIVIDRGRANIYKIILFSCHETSSWCLAKLCH